MSKKGSQGVPGVKDHGHLPRREARLLARSRSSARARASATLVINSFPDDTSVNDRAAGEIAKLKDGSAGITFFELEVNHFARALWRTLYEYICTHSVQSLFIVISCRIRVYSVPLEAAQRSNAILQI